MKQTQHKTNWKSLLYKIIYETGNPAKKWFDFVLITLILLSVILVSLESVESINSKYHNFLNISEWAITVLFTLEYFVRILVAKKPVNYIFSFYGIIDLFAIIPKYVSVFFVGSQALVVLRIFRFLRAFKILKLTRYIVAYGNLLDAIKASRTKILTFLFSVLIVTVILGTIMFLVEGSENGFSNIPLSMYWSIVTLTTAGHGDMIPHTPFGQFIASLVMILGYVTIAVPVGIFTAEIIKQDIKIQTEKKTCPHCFADNNPENAIFCNQCGKKLDAE